ncbi:MAG: efflux RND transporter periplasmic adaptor subunit [Opitutae bacterium]|nr:efflux RND transporter periplasmic adaptor subunit [Opitutae bacterium]
MNSSLRFLALAFVALIFALGLAAAEQLYTCGMHPQILKKEPGNCPICGMALTPVRNNSVTPSAAGERKIRYYKSSMNPGEVSDQPGKDSMGMDLVPVYEGGDTSAQTIRIDAATVQRMNLKTSLVTRGPVLRELRTVGSVSYNEAGLRDITLKYEGWIEKLFVNTTWTAVKAGDPLFEIYSPDLYNAGLNYLVALRTEGASGGPLTRASLARLQLFDLPADYLAELARAGEAPRTYVYRAPADGMVIEKMAVAGQMMKPGERIYRLADLSSVWVLAQIYEQDLAFVRAGQDATVRVTYGPERLLEGRVETLLPQVEEQTRTATARIVLPNPDASLRPGMFVDVRFVAKLADDAVLVPDLAVLRSGEHNTVFIARDNGTFEPREVRLGVRSQGNFYEVLSGLAAGERVVVSGQFMLDSESQLRDAIQKMLNAAGQTPASRATPPPARQREEDGPEPHPTADAAATMVGMDDASALPESAMIRLRELAETTIDGATALAADDFAQYQKVLPTMRQALANYLGSYEHATHGPLGKFKDALPDRPDLKAARRDFAYFSTAIADLARENHLHHTGGLHIFQCPMAPGIGTGRWLQRSGEIKNPFYGAAMPGCGDELDAAGSAGSIPGGMATLPPGHPSITGLSIATYLRSLPGSKATGAAAGGTCGSCGMSEAAMAAGEPCATGTP